MNEDLNISSPNTIDSNFVKYSIDETVIGEWIDGKPVYRKVFTGTETVNDSSGKYVTNLVDCSSLNVDEVISLTGNIIFNADTTNPRVFQLPMQSISSTNVIESYCSILFKKTDSMIRLASYKCINPVQYKIILEYTKTTD